MNRDILSGQWSQLKGKVREQWGRLTENDVDQLHGNAEMLIGKLQERYGHTREQAEKDLDRWLEQRGSVRGAMPRAQDVTERLTGSVQETVDRADETIRTLTGRSLASWGSDAKVFINRYPMPSAVAGLALGYVIARALHGR